jgi:hypothetical protein
LYQDRLYVNDGHGNFEKDSQAIPVATTSGSYVAAADYDKDGDIDLFVGGRHTPANYAVIPRSYLLQNNSTGESIEFVDATKDVNIDLGSVGMVTAACWTDFNNDSWMDLIVVGEWMPVRIFQNDHGKLTERTDFPVLQKSHGWYSDIFQADIDDDGDMDYFLGNAGTNLQFKATEDKPVQLHVADFNEDGTLDPIVSYYIKGESYPLASRDELLEQVNSLRKKFIKYEDYSAATIHDIGSKEQLDKAYKFSAYNLESYWLENIDGKDFKRRSLPPLAQISCINGFLFDDFDGNGKNELLLAGNFYPFKPQLGKSDASSGLLLSYESGEMKVTQGTLSNVWLTGDIRDVVMARTNGGKKKVIVSRNNDKASAYEVVSGE